MDIIKEYGVQRTTPIGLERIVTFSDEGSAKAHAEMVRATGVDPKAILVTRSITIGEWRSPWQEYERIQRDLCVFLRGEGMTEAAEKIEKEYGPW